MAMEDTIGPRPKPPLESTVTLTLDRSSYLQLQKAVIACGHIIEEIPHHQGYWEDIISILIPAMATQLPRVQDTKPRRPAPRLLSLAGTFTSKAASLVTLGCTRPATHSPARSSVPRLGSYRRYSVTADSYTTQSSESMSQFSVESSRKSQVLIPISSEDPEMDSPGFSPGINTPATPVDTFKIGALSPKTTSELKQVLRSAASQKLKIDQQLAEIRKDLDAALDGYTPQSALNENKDNTANVEEEFGVYQSEYSSEIQPVDDTAKERLPSPETPNSPKTPLSNITVVNNELLQHLSKEFGTRVPNAPPPLAKIKGRSRAMMAVAEETLNDRDPPLVIRQLNFDGIIVNQQTRSVEPARAAFRASAEIKKSETPVQTAATAAAASRFDLWAMLKSPTIAAAFMSTSPEEIEALPIQVAMDQAEETINMALKQLNSKPVYRSSATAAAAASRAPAPPPLALAPAPTVSPAKMSKTGSMLRLQAHRAQQSLSTLAERCQKTAAALTPRRSSEVKKKEEEEIQAVDPRVSPTSKESTKSMYQKLLENFNRKPEKKATPAAAAKPAPWR